MIPDSRALIGWSYAEDGHHVGKVVVIELPPDASSDDLGPREWRQAQFTFGACFRDWLTSKDPLMNPAGVFGEMLTGEGFASPQHAINALRAFAKIEGCDWARAMLAVTTP